ncbi:MBL fold metallo-hydrolase [Thermus filiformis]|uniref:Hydrolase n=1 Tax=Thermus filiformis TaxID=276 RepID=A0A0A2WN06_THEFI|nr:MBL fold metallo-hydrolase [Thermus filiformis]KGQ21153.1 hydrolase [Thermus filiformis]
MIRLVVGALSENTYLVDTPEGPVLIDPGDEAERIRVVAEKAGMRPRAILLTHAHFDHLGAVGPLVEAWDVPVYLHPLDLPLYRRAPELARAFGLYVPPPPEEVQPLEEGLSLFGFTVWHLPGHSPGHVAFLREGEVYSGDLLFKGGIGRYDLPGSDGRALFASLRRLLSLPPKTRVYPGHGPPTDLAGEARTNPFLIQWEA